METLRYGVSVPNFGRSVRRFSLRLYCVVVMGEWDDSTVTLIAAPVNSNHLRNITCS